MNRALDSNAVRPRVFTEAERLLGLLPLGFFVAHGFYYWTHGGLPHMLWMCNLANLLLGLSILAGFGEGIRVSVFWLIPGLLIWIWFVVIVDNGWLLTSTFSHIGGLAVGLWALYRVRAARLTGLYATAWYLAVQQVCRMFTPPDLNVNVANRIYTGYESTFTAYWQYWAATTAMVAVGMLVLGVLAG
ncbi:MAG TPA: hypothetical protein VFV34_17800, partial [Blastocatellia bacterium]|nr:hypothetical protein [Blastocatellia bacterium]